MPVGGFEGASAYRTVYHVLVGPSLVVVPPRPRITASGRRTTEQGSGAEFMNIDIVLDVKTVLGEGPLWDVEQERLYWSTVER
jgi:hypothetical protein